MRLGSSVRPWSPHHSTTSSGRRSAFRVEPDTAATASVSSPERGRDVVHEGRVPWRSRRGNSDETPQT